MVTQAPSPYELTALPAACIPFSWPRQADSIFSVVRRVIYVQKNMQVNANVSIHTAAMTSGGIGVSPDNGLDIFPNAQEIKFAIVT